VPLLASGLMSPSITAAGPAGPSASTTGQSGAELPRLAPDHPEVPKDRQVEAEAERQLPDVPAAQRGEGQGVLGGAEHLVLAVELLPQLHGLAAHRVGPADAVVHVDRDVLPVGPALQRHETGEEQLLAPGGGDPPPHVRGDRPELGVSTQESPRLPHLQLALPAPARVAPRVPRVEPQLRTHPVEGVVVVGGHGDPRDVALHAEVGVAEGQAPALAEVAAHRRGELGASLLESPQQVVPVEPGDEGVDRLVVVAPGPGPLRQRLALDTGL